MDMGTSAQGRAQSGAPTPASARAAPTWQRRMADELLLDSEHGRSNRNYNDE